MKKMFKAMTCLGLCGALGLGLAGCGSSSDRDPEVDALKLAIGAVDQKFNPMFYTSQNDGTIANLTQISLVGARPMGDNHVKVAYGENEPVVALDYIETYYDSGNNVLGTDRGDGSSNVKSDSIAYSTYEYVIKSGVKFSDGKDLTVMDVLFNLYVYLDPVYSGSSTIYSTKIDGLQAYRQQDEGAGDDPTDSMLEIYTNANNRLEALKEWSDDANAANPAPDSELGKDLAKVKELYMEELESDWSSVATSWAEDYKDYSFKDEWQVFYFITGAADLQKKTDAETHAKVKIKGGDGKWLTDFDKNSAERDGYVTGTVEAQHLIDDMAAATSGLSGAELDTKQRQTAINTLYEANTAKTKIRYVLENCATGDSAYNYFVAQERTKDVPVGDLAVPTVRGITVSKLKSGANFNGKSYQGDHDVLKIRVNGADPKAKWNFAFSVAPLHYYSDLAEKPSDGYAAKAMNDYKNGKIYDGTGTNFGVKYGDIEWFNNVLGERAKSGLPVGAGAYKASNSSHSGTVTANGFFNNNIAYFERNTNFSTLGSGINNAKIKYVNYKVTRDDMIVSALNAEEIDYGEPTASTKNQNLLTNDDLEQIRYLTGGYGYVGINPKYVKEVELREAIMMTFDKSWITEYYGSTLVRDIKRPMSLTSWAYPNDPSDSHSIKHLPLSDANKTELRNLITGKGNYTYSNGKIYKRGSSEQLSLTFVIAGESTDHPAYDMFVASAKYLGDVGISVSVETDSQALKKLVTGDLAVWAAAWSSSIDPDPYQIYSMNSNASSTRNWYKDGILANSTEYAYEYDLMVRISALIDEGRSTLNEKDRIKIYADCLDCIMDMRVEFPSYQRYDLCVYNSRVIDGDSIYGGTDEKKPASFLMGPISEIWNVEYD